MTLHFFWMTMLEKSFGNTESKQWQLNATQNDKNYRTISQVYVPLIKIQLRRKLNEIFLAPYEP